jgi:hypothetical protein
MLENIKVYKKEKEPQGWDEVRIINMETGEFISYMQDREMGFPFSITNTNITDMGYTSAKECIKTLKQRKMLGNEIDYKDQKESERTGYLNLGIQRIKSNNRINTKDFEDVIEKLSSYGMGYVDAQNQITAMYLHEKQ